MYQMDDCVQYYLRFFQIDFLYQKNALYWHIFLHLTTEIHPKEFEHQSDAVTTLNLIIFLSWNIFLSF